MLCEKSIFDSKINQTQYTKFKFINTIDYRANTVSGFYGYTHFQSHDPFNFILPISCAVFAYQRPINRITLYTRNSLHNLNNHMAINSQVNIQLMQFVQCAQGTSSSVPITGSKQTDIYQFYSTQNPVETTEIIVKIHFIFIVCVIKL